ncbi:hypothetical protein B0H19DRAFT_1055127 [Mycena capillaripes]|nr:hypothetical protein B0H19DRAFT_1055127 [Mycena capillaripes]
MSNPTRKTLAQWKLERNTTQRPPQNTSTSTQSSPHGLDLLRNRNPLKSLGPFDGKVGAFAQLGARPHFITTNTDYVPAIPSLQTPHLVYLRSDMRYGTDDPTLWPQQYTNHYSHMPLIAKKGTRPDLAAMWWDPSPQDFVVGSAVTRGLGRLKAARMSPIIDVVDRIVERCKVLEARSPELLIELFGELIAHILMWLEQLRTLPTTFPKMLFALTSLQREVLELDALYEYMTVYKRRMNNYLVRSASGVAQCVGAFVSHPSVAQQLWAAGIPFWLLRPTEVFDAENILEIVPLLEPSLGLPDPDAHGAGAPPALYTGNSTLEKIDAIHRASLYTPWYHDPFETGFDRAPSPSPAPIASTSSHAVTPTSFSPRPHPVRQKKHEPLRYRPYSAKHEKPAAGPAKTDRDKFVALTVPEMPPSVVCMAAALAQVNRGVGPYTNLTTDTRYVLPEPALFANPDPQRRRRFLHHWKLLRDGFLFMLANRPQLLAPQQWRDVLEGHMTKRGPPDSRVYRRSKELEDVILPALEACNVKSIEGFPVPTESLPEFSLAETREIIWDVAETSFRFEFCALDRRASGKTRVDEAKKCFAGSMLVGPPLEMSKQGWASTSLEERHVFVGRTATLMLEVQSPQHYSPYHRSASVDLENAVCCYYTQAFWEHFGRAAVLPMRLDHDLEKEEGEL